jgi:hypothetical protein
VRAPAVTSPVKVAVPAVLVMLTFPELVKPKMDCVPAPVIVKFMAVEVNVPDVWVKLPPTLSVALDASNVPFVRVTSEVNTWVNAPSASVPPDPLITRLKALVTPLVKVAVPPVFVIVMLPVVVNPPEIDCVAVPASVIPPAPLVNVPFRVKLPPRVSRLAPGVSTALALMVRGTLSFNTLAPFREIAPVPPIVIPPVAVKGVGHSALTVRADAPALYTNDADAPYAMVAPVNTFTLAALEMVWIPFIVTVIPDKNVFAPVPPSVKLLKVVDVLIVCATPPNTTVPVPAVKLDPVPVQAVADDTLTLKVVEVPPFSVPLLSVISPVNV